MFLVLFICGIGIGFKTYGFGEKKTQNWELTSI